MSKITGMDPADPFDGTEPFECVQGGQSKMGILSSVLTYVRAALVKADVGLGNVNNTSDADKPISTAQQSALDGKSDAGHTHSGFAAASHSHTAAAVGLGNVDNTSDADKPVSTAQQSALDGKSDAGHTHSGFAAASHSHTAAGVGLGNVDNTRDADKPVSTAQQAALNGKAAAGHSHDQLVMQFTTAAGVSFAKGEIGFLAFDTKLVSAAEATPAAGRGVLVMANDAIGAGAAGEFVMWGVVTGLSGLTDGAYFLSKTAKGMTKTAPAVSGDIVRVVGRALKADEFYFKPDESWATV